MKTKMSIFSLITMTAAVIASQSSAFAGQGGSTGVGGGGDFLEARVDEVRADILKWINEGGSELLRFPHELNAQSYRAMMTHVLAPHAVIVGFVTTNQEAKSSDPELHVSVDGQPKTCRSFLSTRDARPHILCNAERFVSTPEPKQYSLIHHEYAGLTGVEANQGASSDYLISSQLTEYLVPETVLRLSVKKASSEKSHFWTGTFELVSDNSKDCDDKIKTREVNAYVHHSPDSDIVRSLELITQRGDKEYSTLLTPDGIKSDKGCDGNRCEKRVEKAEWQGETLNWRQQIKITNDCLLGFWCAGHYGSSFDTTRRYAKVDEQTLLLTVLTVTNEKKDVANTQWVSCKYRKIE